MAVSVAVREQRPAWLNLRTIFGATLFLMSLASGWHLLEGAQPGVRLWAAARDLAVGVPLEPGDLVSVAGDLGPGQSPLYLSAEVDLTGAELTRATKRGELLAAGFVSPPDEGFDGQAITIPVTPEHAVGGDLTRGDLVDVYATSSSGQGRGRTTLVVESAQILDLVSASDLMAESSTLTGLTLEVTASDAADLAHAIRTAEVDIVKVGANDPLASTGSLRGSEG